MAAQAADLGPPRAAWAAAYAGRRPVLFDGNGTDSWGDGLAWFAAEPAAVLVVRAPGVAEVSTAESRQELGLPPLTAWQHFLEAAWQDGAIGVASALAYDLKQWTEPHPRRHPWPPEPLLFAAAYRWAYRFDYRTRRGSLSGTPPPDTEARLRSVPASGGCRLPPPIRLRPCVRREEYEAAIRQALEYIAAGDVYQVNLAQTFRCRADPGHAPGLFAVLRDHYPVPFAALVETGAHCIVSASPECFLMVEGRQVRTCPIKGTRRRRAHPRAIPLHLDPKERAEHVMIVDLERNDLGRVCRTGSVRASTEPRVRSFPLLEHMVSEVSGTLRDDVTMADLFAAVFPGGSITGAPKRRAMEIIEELEPEPRGMYTGAIGWIERGERARFSVAIRTAVIGREGLRYAAGGGIVADSVPSREYEETLLKAEAVARALCGGDPRLGSGAR